MQCRLEASVKNYRAMATEKVDVKAKEKDVSQKLASVTTKLIGFQKRESSLQETRRENHDLLIQNVSLQAERDNTIKK